MFAYTAAASRDLDQAAQTALSPAGQANEEAGFELMHRAGRAAFDELNRRYPAGRAMLVLAGKGNNGGDAYVVAGLAAQAGWRVQLWQCIGTIEKLVGEAARAQRFAEDLGVTPLQSDPADTIAEYSVAGEDDQRTLIVDGLFGTGLVRPPGAPIDALIARVNQSALPVVALDVPSGLNATTGATPGVAIQADLTITFIGMKLGLLTGVGPEFAGELVLAELGVAARVRRRVPGVAVFNQVSTPFEPRTRAAYKNQFGHLLVVGGDQGTGGAIILAAQAALRTGAGLVSVATRRENVSPLLVRCPELMGIAVEGAGDILPALTRATLVVVGPGLGQGPWGEQLLQAVFTQVSAAGIAVNGSTRPLVLDADALNLVAAGMTPPAGCVMTPHPGEAARLLNCRVADIADDRIAAAKAIATTYKAFVVLKGVGSLIAAPPQPGHVDAAYLVGVCALGNPGMASAGMGDVLSGILGGLIAQEGLQAQTVARAVQMHAAAGDLAADRLGMASMIASDLINQLPHVIS